MKSQEILRTCLMLTALALPGSSDRSNTKTPSSPPSSPRSIIIENPYANLQTQLFPVAPIPQGVSGANLDCQTMFDGTTLCNPDDRYYGDDLFATERSYIGYDIFETLLAPQTRLQELPNLRVTDFSGSVVGMNSTYWKELLTQHGFDGFDTSINFYSTLTDDKGRPLLARYRTLGNMYLVMDIGIQGSSDLLGLPHNERSVGAQSVTSCYVSDLLIPVIGGAVFIEEDSDIMNGCLYNMQNFNRPLFVVSLPNHPVT